MKITAASAFFFLLPLTLTLTFQVLAANPTTGSAIINKACQRALYKDFCIATLKAANGSQQADLNGLAVIALNLATSNATDTSRYITQLLNTTTEPFIEQCLTDCSENYMDAVEQLEDSIAALVSKGYSDVNTWVTAAMADAQSCEEGFKDGSRQESLLTHRNTVFNRLCSNVLAITNVLAGV